MAKSKPHVFLCCFGFSGKFRRFKPAAGRRKRPFSWMRVNAKPPAVRSAFPADRNRSNPDSDRLLSGSIALTTADMPPSEDPAAVVPAATNRAGEGTPEKVRNDSVSEHSDTPKKSGSQSQTRFSLTRKLGSFRSGRFSQPASPTAKKDPKSVPFPPANPTRVSRVENPPTGIRVGSDGDKTGKAYQSMAGISILIVVLAIIVLWGRLYAILCTAVWIFIITSLGSIVEEDDEIDFIDRIRILKGLRRN